MLEYKLAAEIQILQLFWKQEFYQADIYFWSCFQCPCRNMY